MVIKSQESFYDFFWAINHIFVIKSTNFKTKSTYFLVKNFKKIITKSILFSPPH